MKMAALVVTLLAAVSTISFAECDGFLMYNFDESTRVSILSSETTPLTEFNLGVAGKESF